MNRHVANIAQLVSLAKDRGATPLAPASRRVRRIQRARRTAGGFTLVELMISLVMGLIISLAVVGLAKTATATFHEQARISSVEMALRASSERLRSDLLKVSYMSTANVKIDPKIARRSNGTAVVDTSMAELRGIQVRVGGSRPTAEGTMNLATYNGVNPDDAILTGNTTSDDMYRGQWIDAGTCGGGGARLRLNALSDPATTRLFNGAAAPADIVRNVQSAFMPGMLMTPPVTTARYLTQIRDMRGCYHYLPVCAVVAGPNANTVFVDVAGTGGDGILTPETTGNDQCGGRLMEEFTIAPVQRVRWYLDANADARLHDTVTEGTGAHKFNLYRQLLTYSGDPTVPVGPPELVAEYAVDLKFGLVVDDTPRSPAPNNVGVYEFDIANADIQAWSEAPLSTITGQPGPQRIRSVRYKVAVRSSQPERRQNVAAPAGPLLSRGLFRYCTDTASGCVKWARVRSLISEVALINQARLFY